MMTPQTNAKDIRELRLEIQKTDARIDKLRDLVIDIVKELSREHAES